MLRPSTIVDRLHGVFNARDWDAYRELLDEHVEYAADGGAIHGRAPLIDYLKAAAGGRPGLRYGPSRVIAETEDTLVSEVRIIDRTDSPEQADAPGYSCCAIHRLAGGRIVEWRSYTAPANLEIARAPFVSVAAEQLALRRVAELVAEQAQPEQVFTLVTEELNRLVGDAAVSTARFEPDGTATILATSGVAKDRLPPGRSVALEEESTVGQVFRTGRAAYVEDYSQVGGEIGPSLSRLGLRWGAAGPIVVDGRLWGAMAIAAASETMPPGTEQRVAQFAELVSTAISNVESRNEVERLAAEQAALRRVAELVAAQPPPDQVFGLVTEELSHLMDVSLARMVRFEPDGSATVVAARGSSEDRLAEGTNHHPLPRGTLIEQVFRTGKPARVEDYAEVSGAIGDVLRQEGTRSGAGGPIIVDERLWGAMVVGTTVDTLPPAIEHRVAQFAELVSTAISNVESRAKVELLAAEQSALRRVATLVARTPASEQLYSAVAREVASVLDVPGVIVTRDETDGTVVTLGEAFNSELAGAGRFYGVGTRTPRDPGSLAAQVFETQRPARIDDFSALPGTIGDRARAAGFGSGCAGPIMVDGALWGKMCVFSPVGTVLPVGTENRLHDFVELIATAIANHEAHAELAASEARARELAEEQAALRRVATLVARGLQPQETFSGVCEEVGRVFGSPYSGIARFEPDGSGVVIVGLSEGISNIPIGTRWPFEEFMATTLVYRTGRPARNERSGWEDTSGPVADRLRELGLISTVAAPIVVEGRLWGLITISDAHQRLPPDAEERLAAFTELVATAIASTQSRTELAVSEARAHDLAREQIVLRRVATLVAEGATPSRVLDAVRDEVERMFGIPNTILMRFDADGTASLLATPGDYIGVIGSRWPLEADESAVARVYRSGRAARADYTAGAVGPLAQAAERGGTRFPVAVPVVVDGTLWGAMSVGSRGPEPPPADLEGRLAKFTELLATAIANAESRADLAASEAHARELAEEQSALRRVATLVASAPASERVFSTIAREVASVLNMPRVVVERFEADGASVIIGTANDADLSGVERLLGIGTRTPADSGSLTTKVFRTKRTARVEDFSTLPGAIPAAATAAGIGSGCAGPIVVNGRLWGMLAVFSRAGTALPAGTENRLHDFIELLATSITSHETRADLAASEAHARELADEQAALRRVATLVAQGASPDELFLAVATEVSGVVDAPIVAISRYEADRTLTILGIAGERSSWIGTQWPVWGVAATILDTGRPARQDDFVGMPAQFGDPVRDGLTQSWQEMRSVVAAPIVVEGSLWGFMSAAHQPGTPIPSGTEERLVRFTELVATAVSNTTARTDLLTSRARLVTAADESRRRLERDLHDGIQQRLIALAFRARKGTGLSVADGSTVRALSDIADDLVAVTDELREISRGIHPAVLSDAGLDDALKALARRSAIQVDLDVSFQGRYDTTLEATVYYVVAESITNSVKHARASSVTVRGGSRDGALELEIADDGVGGADPRRGTGMIGLKDRVDTLGGTISFVSPAGAGTRIRVTLPARAADREEQPLSEPDGDGAPSDSG